MNKVSKYLLLLFGFVFAFFALDTQVSAKETILYSNPEQVKGCLKEDQSYGETASNFWEIMCDNYTVIPGREDDSSKYVFEQANHNFTFEYDYEVTFDPERTYIRDGGTDVFSFIGISEDTTITYMDIDIGSIHVFPETFVVYEYDSFRGRFTKVSDISANSSGSYVINKNGIYKLETYVENGGTSYVKYLVYESSFYYASLRTVSYESDYQNLIYYLQVSTPRNLNSCGDIRVRIVANSSDIVDCNIEFGDKVGEYDITIYTMPQSTYINNKTTTVSYNGENLTAYITYDSGLPEIVDELITYYPSSMLVEEFAVVYNDEPLTLPQSAVAIFEYVDDSVVDVKLNNKACTIITNKVTCEIAPRLGSTLRYSLVDAYGNEINVLHSDITYGDLGNVSAQTLKQYIEIQGNEIKFSNIEEYSQFEKICLFYGNETTNYSCANMTSELIVYSDKYYVGPINVVLADVDMNVVKIAFDNVTLDTGFDPSMFEVSDIVGDLTSRQDVTVEVQNIIAIACAGEENCLETVKVYGKYGSETELLSSTHDITSLKLPTYIEILNKGYTHKACAFERCNETIEVYVSYVVGGVNQKLSAKYSYIDKLPQITTTIDDYKLTRKYDFSQLDITDFYTKRELFADPLGVTLTDGEGTIYEGTINSRFVKYTDRQGNVQILNDMPYTYIANKNSFGYYLLEGRVTLNKNVTTGTNINTQVYGKSFFVNVELADTKAPTLTLVGDETMSLKQYDVFKDPEFKCTDNSGCTLSIKYYYETEDEEVEKVDTSVPGKYIIVYSAVDADGNVSELRRIVNVESVNAMNATAIIIIVAVVLVFAGSIALAVWLEIKRKREGV